ncbi:Septin-domain-containing protein [Geopyxis carbonaria]|nr:Septin-domain-containing protein [Geopyxis carbonaria]
MSSRPKSDRRPATPKSSDNQSAEKSTVPPLPTKPLASRNSTSNPPRRSSLGFLRRSKSGDPVRKMHPVVAPSAPKLPDLWVNGSGNPANFPKQLLTKDVRDSVDILSNNLGGVPNYSTPRSQHQLGSNLGGYVPGRKSTDSVIGPGGEYVKSSSVPLSQDPYANIGSMAHRGRYSYASSAVSTVNSPRRVRRRKDPTPFNILIIGARNSGKTSFLRFLRQSLALKGLNEQEESGDAQTNNIGTTSNNSFKSTYIETEIDGERIGLTLWDSAGLEKNIVDLQIRETVAFIENKFEDTFSEETKVVRAPGVKDTHIHCAFLLLDPARLTPNNHYLGKVPHDQELGGLDKDLDIQVLKALHGKTVVVPVISKADSCTSKHMEHLKNLVREGLAKARVDPLEALELEIDEDDVTPVTTPKDKRGSLPELDEPPAYEEMDTDSGEMSEEDDYAEENEVLPEKVLKSALKRASSPKPSTLSEEKRDLITAGLSFIPLSIISPDSYQPGEPVGRHFPWGFADPYNDAHCDFGRLKDSVFSEWRGELREKSRINWYEFWRSERLGAAGKTKGRRRGI